MTIIYCAKDKRAEAKAILDLEYNHVFASPNDTAVDHSATRVIIVGNHPAIAERYAGLAKVEHVQLDSDQPEPETGDPDE